MPHAQASRRVRSRWLLALAGLAFAACATLKPPTLAVDALKVGDMGITGVAMDVTFRVQNPNPEPLRVERFEYELRLNGERLGRGYQADGFELPAFGEQKVTSRFNVNLLSLPGAVKNVLERDRARAKVKGHFYVTQDGGTKKLGFDADADVKLGH